MNKEKIGMYLAIIFIIIIVVFIIASIGFSIWELRHSYGEYPLSINVPSNCQYVLAYDSSNEENNLTFYDVKIRCYGGRQ